VIIGLGLVGWVWSVHGDKSGQVDTAGYNATAPGLSCKYMDRVHQEKWTRNCNRNMIGKRSG
jgi:hypothetical protein